MEDRKIENIIFCLIDYSPIDAVAPENKADNDNDSKSTSFFQKRIHLNNKIELPFDYDAEDDLINRLYKAFKYLVELPTGGSINIL